jgi:hypothetical protein
MIRKFILLTSLFLLLLKFNLHAQMLITNLEYLPELKKTTTIVFMPVQDTAKHQIYREIIEEHWQISKVLFRPYSQYTEYKYKPGYSYLLFGDDQINDGTSVSSFVYFELWMWNTSGGWEKRKKVQIARMELFPDPQTTFDPSLVYDYRYSTEGHIFNWTPGFFKNYMQLMERYLERGKIHSAENALQDFKELEKLKKDTLYVPHYVLEQHSADQKILPDLTEKELMGDYPYPYKIINSKQLSDMLIDSNNEIHYLMFVRSNSDKYISVIDGHDGEFIYQRHTPMSFNAKKADLKKLAKTITDGK